MNFDSGQGCLECRTRRVRCDKTEPECFKCCKKGIKCSGQGIECRFSSHMKYSSSPRPSQSTTRTAGDGAKASLRAPNRYRWVTVNSKQPGSSPDTARLASRRASTALSKISNKRPLVGPLPDIPTSDTDSSTESLEDDVEEVYSREMQLSRPQPAIQALSPQARQFFSYCKILFLLSHS